MLKRTLVVCIASIVLSAPIVHGTPVHQWSHRWTGTDDSQFNEIVVDPFGNIGPSENTVASTVATPDSSHMGCMIQQTCPITFWRRCHKERPCMYAHLCIYSDSWMWSGMGGRRRRIIGSTESDLRMQ